MVLGLVVASVSPAEGQQAIRMVKVRIVHGKIVYYGPGRPEGISGTVSYVEVPAPAQNSAPVTNPECVPPCGTNNLVYQQINGTVQWGGTYAYNIFWEPSGSGVDYSSYNSHINTLVSDQNQTGYYGNLTQYYEQDSNGQVHHVVNHSSLQGTYIDNSPFPNQTTTNMVNASQIDAEVQKVIQAKAWPQSLAYQYTVFLGVNPYSHAAEVLNVNGCSFHGPSSLQPTVTDAAVDYGSANRVCAPTYCPNGCTIDAALTDFGHEMMETVTDTVPNTGWVDTSAQQQEIDDKCDGSYPYVNLVYDYSNTLGTYIANHQFASGNYYLLESQWDNAEFGCVAYGLQYP